MLEDRGGRVPGALATARARRPRDRELRGFRRQRRLLVRVQRQARARWWANARREVIDPTVSGDERVFGGDVVLGGLVFGPSVETKADSHQLVATFRRDGGAALSLERLLTDVRGGRAVRARRRRHRSRRRALRAEQEFRHRRENQAPRGSRSRRSPRPRQVAPGRRRAPGARQGRPEARGFYLGDPVRHGGIFCERSAGLERPLARGVSPPSGSGHRTSQRLSLGQRGSISAISRRRSAFTSRRSATDCPAEATAAPRRNPLVTALLDASSRMAPRGSR